MKKNNTQISISILQITVVIIIFPTFFMSVPWLSSQPISSLDNHPEMASQYPPPIWAKCYSVNHGKPGYYRYEPKDRPAMAAGSIFIILGGTLTLIITSLYSNSLSEKKHTPKPPEIRMIQYRLEQIS